jgi:L-amino acid N-acyltransferase YncA
MIRPVEERDIKSITTIYNQYITETTITFETKQLTENEMSARVKSISVTSPYFICEEDGNLLGYCYAHPWKERAAYSKSYETTVYISPENRGRGIGTKLMERLIADCRQRGVHALIACITGGNEASNHLHEKLGFHQVSLFRQVGMKFGKWLDVMDYELILE